MNFLRQSTAGQTVILGAMIDDTDFKTPETGLTIANTDVKLMKAGAASVNKNSGGGTHRVNGDYALTLDATDTNTTGHLRANIFVTGALVAWGDWQIVTQAVYDLFFAAGATGEVTLAPLTHTGAVIPTVTSNSDMRGTDSAALAADLAVVDGICDDILVDTNSTLPVQIGALNNFDPTSELVLANVTQISGDAVAADNLEAQYDATGLTGDNFPSTQLQVSAISSSSAATSITSESFTLTTGSQIGTFADTASPNQIYHEVSDAAGVMDVEYTFNIGVSGVPVELTLLGRLFNNNDTLTVEAFNGVTQVHDFLGTLVGTNSATDLPAVFNMLVSHVGVGNNAGLVKIKISGTGLTSATLFIDYCFCSFTSRAQTPVLDSGTLQGATANTATLKASSNGNDKWFQNTLLKLKGGTGAGQSRLITDYDGTTKIVTLKHAWIIQPTNTTDYEIFPASVHVATQDAGYENGAVFVNTLTGTPGTLLEVNGVLDNPVDTWADLLTLSAERGSKNAHIEPGSSITLTANSSNWEFNGQAGVIALGGQDISNAVFRRHNISGVGIGAAPAFFSNSIILNATLNEAFLINCGLTATLTLGAPGNYIIADARDSIAGIVNPVLDVSGDGITPTTVSLLAYEGSIDIKNMTAVDTVGLSGRGELVVNSVNAGGTIRVAGNFNITDNSGGNVTILQDGNVNVVNVEAAALAAANSIHLDKLLAANYDPASPPGATTALLNELIQNDLGVAQFTANALEQGPGGTGLTAQDLLDISDTVWQELLADHSGASGSVAEKLAAIPTTPMRGTDGANTVIPPSLAEFNARTLAAASYFNGATDTVANVTLVGTTTTNTDMRGTDAAATAAALALVKAVVDAIRIDTETDIPTALAALNDLSATEVNAEVVDVLFNDAISEPITVPTVNASFADKLAWVAATVLNKTISTATAVTVRNNADTATIGSSVVSATASSDTIGKVT